MVSKNCLSRIVPLFMAVGLILAGCGTQPTPLTDQSGDFAVSLPRITVDVNADGVPSIAGISPDAVKAMTFGQVDLSNLRVPKEYVDWFTSANIQNVELVHKDDGLYLYVNGKPLPHLGWNSESFDAMGDLVSQTGVLAEPFASIVKMALPFVRNVGADVVIKFPAHEGAAE